MTQTILLPGPAGFLEAITTRPAEHDPVAIGIICHPHPLQEGTMHNKVVTTLAKSMAKQGMATVRFNYRGVGQSEGSYGNSEGEIADLAAVKSWASTVFPGKNCWLAGFSFGAFIAASIANRSQDVRGLITVAPAVHHSDFTVLTGIRCPWLVIQGDQDEVVPYTNVVDFVSHSSLAPRLLTMEGTGHFFHGRLGALQDMVTDWMGRQSEGPIENDSQYP